MFMTKNRELLLETRAQIETLKTALIVMDPRVTTSSDAYEGLRKQVAVSASSRQAHLAQLAQFTRALQRGASSSDLASLVDQWSQQAGLIAVTDPNTNPDLFEVLEGEAGVGTPEMLSPAYVDQQHGRLVAMGEARWVKWPEAASQDDMTADRSGADDGADASTTPENLSETTTKDEEVLA